MESKIAHRNDVNVILRSGEVTYLQCALSPPWPVYTLYFAFCTYAVYIYTHILVWILWKRTFFFIFLFILSFEAARAYKRDAKSRSEEA